MPYQEWRRERPDEARQPVDSRCQIRRQTKDEGSYHNTFRIFGTSFFCKKRPAPGAFGRNEREKKGMELWKKDFYFECVTTGHPDKVADRISDSILDACLAQDPNSRVACETLVTTDFCCISGEITTNALVDYEAIARQVIRDIGYTRPDEGFCADTAEIQCRIHTQSPDIALGTNDQVGGAGDQG